MLIKSIHILLWYFNVSKQNGIIIFNSSYFLQPNPASYMQPSWITQTDPQKTWPQLVTQDSTPVMSGVEYMSWFGWGVGGRWPRPVFPDSNPVPWFYRERVNSGSRIWLWACCGIQSRKTYLEGHSRQWSTVYLASRSKGNQFPTTTLMFLRGPVLYPPPLLCYMLATSVLNMIEFYNK